MKHPDLPDDHDANDIFDYDDEANDDISMLGFVIMYCVFVFVTVLATWWIA